MVPGGLADELGDSARPPSFYHSTNKWETLLTAVHNDAEERELR